MKNLSKATHLLAFLLVIALVTAFLPTSALAATEGDYIYSDNGDGTCTITGYIGLGGDLTIPETLGGKTVTIIGNTAFFSTLLTSVTIPDTVTTIQDEAFSTNNITSVTLGSGVETIGVFAFADSFSLTSVTLPPSLTQLDVHAFNYTGMSEITLPEPEEGYISTWENGSGTVFHGGDTVPVDKSYTRTSYLPIFEYHYFNKSLNLIRITGYNGLGGNIVIPDTIDGHTVFGIGYRVFYNKAVSAVTLPNSVMFVETEAFAGNGSSGLSSFTLPGPYRGYTSTWLTSGDPSKTYVSGDTVTDLNHTTITAEYLYCDNGSDTASILNYYGIGGDVDIPDTFGDLPVTHILDFSFAVKGITSIKLPCNLVYIGIGAFTTNNITSVTIPDSVKEIGEQAFLSNGLTSVHFGNGLQTIGKWAFMANSLSSVTLPSSLTELSLEAFLNSGVTEITLPQPEAGYISTWENGSGAEFHGGDSVPVGDTYTRTSFSSIFEYVVEDEFLKLINITGYNGLGGDVVIPSTIDGYTVYGIEYRALYDKGLTSVTLPDSLMFLEGEVFANNTGLTSFNLPGAYKGFTNVWYEYKMGRITHAAGDTVTDMNANFRAEYEFCQHPDGSAIINNCNAEYTDICVPAAFGSLSTGHIGDDAFFGNFFTGDLTIPGSVISIGFAAFADNELTSVTIPRSVKKIGTYVFFMNPDISAFNLPSAPVGYTSIWNEIDPGSDVMSTDDDTMIGEHRSNDAVTNLTHGFEWVRNEVNEYTVTFTDHDGTEIQRVTQNYGTALNCPKSPTREGYTFSGWSSDLTTIPAENTTITAIYTINEYTVTFTDHDGIEIQRVTQNYGTALNYPKSPTREGYTFSGWSSNIATIPAEDVTITAIYTINQYTVTFTDHDGTEIQRVTQNYGTALNCPKSPTIEGYTFSGWSSNIATIPAEDVTITATYTENPPADVQRGTICGTLIGSDGKPLAGQTVTLHSDPVTAVTNSKGRFTFSNVPLTDHTMILQKSDGTEIGRYTLSFLQSTDTSYTLDDTDVDVKVTANTVMIDILINLNDAGSVTIEDISFGENPDTGETHASTAWMLWAGVLIILAAAVFAVFARCKTVR